MTYQTDFPNNCAFQWNVRASVAHGTKLRKQRKKRVGCCRGQKTIGRVSVLMSEREPGRYMTLSSLVLFNGSSISARNQRGKPRRRSTSFALSGIMFLGRASECFSRPFRS